MRGSFYTVEKIGPNRAKTPEGFLLCIGVAIARTGMMIYGPEETPIGPGPDGITKIFRDAEQVFRAETMASALGKSVTNDHPEGDVDPKNWKLHEIGTMLNVRRGAGNEDDLLQADLLIKDAEGIRIVESGKSEASLGYDADYVEVEPGIGRQKNIHINHVAVVAEGRCGPRCAIRDHKTIDQDDATSKTRDSKATSPKTASVRDKLHEFFTRAFKAKDAAEVDKLVEDAAAEMEEAGTGDTHVHVHTGDDDAEARWKKNDDEHAELRERIATLEKAIAGKKTGDTGEGNPDPNKNTQGKQGHNPGTLDAESEEAKKKAEAEEAEKKKAADKARDEEVRADEMALDEVPEGSRKNLAKNKDKTKDSAFLGDSLRDAASLAEILVPGVQIPTFDTAARPGATAKQLCAFRRSVLDAAYKNQQDAAMIEQLHGKKLNTAVMTCDAVRTLFRAAAVSKQTVNNSRSAKGGTHDANHGPVGVVALADVDARNAAHWAKK